MTIDDSDKDLDELMGLILRMRQLFAQRQEFSLGEHSTSPLQFWALCYIKANPAASMSEVAASLGLSTSSATQLTERLVKGGYLERLEDERDRRIVRLRVTRAGSIEMGAVQGVIRSRMRSLFVTLPPADLKQFVRIHRELIKNLEKLPEG